jgi:ribonuclease HII
VALDFTKEKNGWSKGYRYIVGIDEAGRGPLAGPVVAAAVIFPENSFLDGLDDSKKLTPKKRAYLFDQIKELASVGIGIISPKKIDEINIYQATRLAMKTAAEDLNVIPDCLLIDGNTKIDMAYPQQTIVKGDSKVASIAAASVIAKVTRDRIMEEYHKEMPQYGFDGHKGYPSKGHIEAIREHGYSSIHRRSFKPKALAGIVV